MSLQIGKAFISALRSNTDLLQVLGGKGKDLEGARIFSVARPQEDESQDKIPYIIIQPQGLTAQTDKDGYEEGDNDTVSILIVAAHYTTTAINGKIEIGLVELSQMVRDTIATMLVEEHDGFQIDDYSLTVGPTQMDVQKPCYFHEFTYQTNTQNTDQS